MGHLLQFDPNDHSLRGRIPDDKANERLEKPPDTSAQARSRAKGMKIQALTQFMYVKEHESLSKIIAAQTFDTVCSRPLQYSKSFLPPSIKFSTMSLNGGDRA